MAVKNYIFEGMKFAEVLVVLCDHCFTFEQIREMTMTEIFDALKRINAGEIKSHREMEAERKAKAKK